MSRVFVFGLDGGDPEVLRAGFESGRLPVLKKLADEGRWGPSRSTHPPLTPPAWTSFITGVGPARHGIFGFVAREPGSYTTGPVSATDRRHPTLFSRLAASGKAVAAVTVPWTYPPEDLPGGCVVGGSGTPGSTRAGVSPPSFFDDIERFGGIPFTPAPPPIPRFLQRSREAIRRRFQVGNLAMERFDPDVFMLVAQETDQVSHRFWRPGPIPPKVMDVYSAADELIGEFLENFAGSGDAVLVVSDHGSGPCSLRVQMNRLLLDLGYLRASRGRPSLVRRAVRGARGWTRLSLKGSGRRRVRAMIPAGMMRQLSTYMHHTGIDWSKTVAYSMYEYGAVHINVKGRDPQGIVDPREYERVRGEVKQALESIITPSGEPLFSKVWVREDLYEGPFVDEAPDLVGDANDSAHGIYGWWDLSVPPFLQPSDTGVEDRNRVGMHRPSGIYLLSDPLVASTTENEPVDLPSILPAVLAGRSILPLESDLADRWYGHRGGDKEAVAVDSTPRGETLPEGEKEEITQRLREMGYLD
ncbi:MAG: alkaline phosphatase family protein [Actinomycetota bacterium]